MGAVQVLNRERDLCDIPGLSQVDSVDWIKVAAIVSMITSGCLLLTGQRRAAMVAAASGTALLLADQRDLVQKVWRELPGYVDQAQKVVTQVQGVVEEITAKSESLRRALGR
jgi:hypothetical protein